MKGFNPQQEIVIVTVISQKGIPVNMVGQKKVFSLEGEAGKLPFPWLEDKVAELARSYLVKGKFDVISFSGPQEEQTVTIMIDPYRPPPELIILGGWHITPPLVSIGRLLGYRVTVVDDRSDFVSSDRLPEADKVIYCSFNDIEGNLTLGPRSSVVIATRGHRHDLDCLRQVIKYPLAYLGFVGNRQRVHMVKQQLIEEGFDVRKLDKVHICSGLNIGAQTPGEIAVSIAAELIMARRVGSASILGKSCPEAVTPVDVYEKPSSIDLETLQEAIRAACEDMPAALATVVKTKGSSLLKAGARMLVYGDGRIFGTIGGVACESEVRQEALNVINEVSSRLYKVFLDTDATAMGDKACSEVMEIFIEPVNKFAWIFNES